MLMMIFRLLLSNKNAVWQATPKQPQIASVPIVINPHHNPHKINT
jgi:hypothetical protein